MVPGKFEGFSVNGKTSGAADGFSDGNPLAATEGAVEGIRVGVIIEGDNVGDSDPDHGRNKVGDEDVISVGWTDGRTDGTNVDSSVAGKFEMFSVNGGAGDGFSDGDPLAATEGAVEGKRVGVIIVGDNVGDSDPDHGRNTVGDEDVISVGWADG